MNTQPKSPANHEFFQDFSAATTAAAVDFNGRFHTRAFCRCGRPERKGDQVKKRPTIGRQIRTIRILFTSELGRLVKTGIFGGKNRLEAPMKLKCPPSMPCRFPNERNACSSRVLRNRPPPRRQKPPDGQRLFYWPSLSRGRRL